MNDKKLITAGIVVFIAAVCFPFWFNMGKAAPVPKVELTEKAKAAQTCVRSTDFMRAEHMELLDVCREQVVRSAQREYVAQDGRVYDMSLSNTCLDCHSNKAEFCDRCHNYVSVSPYCWDCHIDNPKETE